MKKRVLVGALWAATAWYVGAVAAWMLNVGPALSVVLAVSAGAMFAADPRGIIWSRQQRSRD